jgi:hypothetical protein
VYKKLKNVATAQKWVLETLVAVAVRYFSLQKLVSVLIGLTGHHTTTAATTTTGTYVCVRN